MDPIIIAGKSLFLRSFYEPKRELNRHPAFCVTFCQKLRMQN